MKTDLKSVTALCKRVAKDIRNTAAIVELVPDEHGYRLAEEWAGSLVEDLALAAAQMAALTRALRKQRVKKTEQLEKNLKAERAKLFAKGGA
jgi:hypothetical protein